MAQPLHGRNRPLAGVSRRHIIIWMPDVTWFKVEQLPWPADWPALFGRSAPLIIEVGFGSGLFLADLAKKRADANFIGLEISIPAIRNAGRKIERSALANVCLIQASAPAAFQALCRPASVDEVIINYPDPWPKKAHHGRRLIDETFLRLLATRMKPGAALDIATDHAEYAIEIAGCLSRSPHFINRQPWPFSRQDPGRLVTKYEQVALDEGRFPHYFKWQRNEVRAEDEFPVPEELPMPHVVLRLPADPADIVRRFKPSIVEVESARIRYVEAYRAVLTDKVMIETYISEDPIMQRIGLEIRARQTGDVVISLAEMGFPRPTRGVHLAIRHLVDQLRRDYPSLVVLQTTLQEDHADRPY